MAHILLMATDFLVVCNRSEPERPWLAKGYQRVLGQAAGRAVERAVREGFPRTVRQLWHEAFRSAPPAARELPLVRNDLLRATSGPMPRLIVLRHAPALPRSKFELPVVQDPGPVVDAPPGHIMWVGFELVDQDDKPFAGQAFLLTAPDGQQSTQRLDERGTSRKDPTLDGPFGFTLVQSEPRQQELQDYVDLEIVDTAGAPIAGTQYQVFVGGALIRAGAVDRDGRAHIEDLPPGPYEIVLPGFEPGAVTLDSTAAHAASGASRPASTYKVTQGDTLAKIAKAHGVKSGKALYDAPENADLRKKRPNSNRIRPGDQVKIPVAAAAALAADAGDVVRLVVQRTDEPVVQWNVSFPADLVEQLPDDTVLELSCHGGATDIIPIAEGKVEEAVVQFEFAWSPPGTKISLVARTAKQSVTLIDGAIPEQGAPWQESLHALVSALKPEPLAALEHVTDAGDYEGEVGLSAEAFDFVGTDEVIV